MKETKTENKMENCKIYVPTEILSKLVHEKIFSKGITWADSKTTVKTGIGEWLLVENGRMYYNPCDDDESPIVSAKKLLGDFDWCLQMNVLSAEQKQAYCDKRGYTFDEFQRYHGRRNNGWDSSPTKWETELDWESFVHLYSIQEVIPQVEEYSQINQQPKMTTQYLTRDQLINLLNQFDCSAWKNEIKKLLTGHEFSIGDTKIDVTGSVSKLISEGTTSQKSAVQALGIVLVEDKSVIIPEFFAIFYEDDKMLEVRCSENPDFDKKSFYLGRDFNWEIKNDGDCLCLVPTKK